MQAVKLSLIDGYLEELNRYDYFRNFTQLIVLLHSIAFEARREMDMNRIKNAEEYRERIASKYLIKYNYFRPVSVLEIWMDLADRYSGILFSPGDEKFDGFAEILELFIENLSLNLYDDNGFDERKVRHIVRKWMDLEYNLDGTNGNIVCKPGYRKLKSLDIWMQLHCVLCPNLEEDCRDEEGPFRHPYVR